MPTSPAMSAQPARKSMNLVVPVLGLVLVVAGFFGGWMLGGKQEFKKGYDQGYAEAKAKVESSGFFPTTSVPVYSLNGTVTAVNSGSIDISVPQTVRNPLDAPAPTTRTVKITADTKIVMSVQKPREQFQKELDAFTQAQAKFQEDLKTGKQTQPPAAPTPTDDKIVTADKLKVGQQVFVTSTENIVTAATFTATQIQVLDQPLSPSPLVPVSPPTSTGPGSTTAPGQGSPATIPPPTPPTAPTHP